MPCSNNAGKEWLGLVFRTLAARAGIRRVLDVGVGQGTYSILGRTPDVEWIGIEVWGPYVEKYKLRDKYDKLIVADARYVDFSMLGRLDFAFLGDVLEHMAREEALALVKKISACCRFLAISMPVIHWEQGALEDNPYEIHVKADWTAREILETFPDICAGVTVQKICVYIIAPLPRDKMLAAPIGREAERKCFGEGKGWHKGDAARAAP